MSNAQNPGDTPLFPRNPDRAPASVPPSSSSPPAHSGYDSGTSHAFAIPESVGQDQSKEPWLYNDRGERLPRLDKTHPAYAWEQTKAKKCRMWDMHDVVKEWFNSPVCPWCGDEMYVSEKDDADLVYAMGQYAQGRSFIIDHGTMPQALVQVGLRQALKLAPHNGCYTPFGRDRLWVKPLTDSGFEHHWALFVQWKEENQWSSNFGRISDALADNELEGYIERSIAQSISLFDTWVIEQVEVEP